MRLPFTQTRLPVSAFIGLTLTGIFLFCAIFAQWIAPYPIDMAVGGVWEGPSEKYWLGTDTIGRDILSRLIYGGQITIFVALASSALAFSLGAATRGVAVGAVTLLAILPFTALPVAHIWAVLYFGIGAALILGMVGIMAGLWAEKFDHMAVVTNFVIMPLTFLSGTFYMVDRLPEPFRSASHYNPFFYLIDGFRYGFIGHAEGSLLAGVGMTAGLVIALAFTCLWMFETGYKLKS